MKSTKNHHQLRPGASVNRSKGFCSWIYPLVIGKLGGNYKKNHRKAKLPMKDLPLPHLQLKSNRSHCGGERLHAIQIVVRILARIVADPWGSYFQGHRARSSFQNLPLPAPAMEDPWKF